MKQQKDMEKENALCSRGNNRSVGEKLGDNENKNVKNDNEISFNPQYNVATEDERDSQQKQHEPITVPCGDFSNSDTRSANNEDELVTNLDIENIPTVASKTEGVEDDSVPEISASELGKTEENCNPVDHERKETIYKDGKSSIDTGMEKTKTPRTKKVEVQKDLNPIEEEDGLGKRNSEISEVALSNNIEFSSNNDVRKTSQESIEIEVKTTKAKNGQTKRAQSGRRPASTIERTNRYELMFDKRPYSAMDASAYKSRKNKALSPRRRSNDQFRFTKAELDWYLPRKSNFDCHDKALKDAGFESEEKLNMIEKRRQKIMERLRKEKEARMKNKENLVESAQNDKKNETENTLAENVPSDSVSFNLKDTEDELVQNDNVEPVMGLKRNTSFLSKKHPKGKRKGLHDDDEDDVRVDHQPLLTYLRYVKENPNEFLSHQKSSIETQHVGQKANQRTQRMAEIMERKQQSLISSRESVVVQAVKDIRPRFTDPGQWSIANKERNFMNTLGGLGSRKDMFPSSKQEAQDSSTSSDEHKSEYEKEKSKLDKWLKTVSTAQLNKAKELALKDLGEEDKYQTRWWSALQTCSYLRQKRSEGINPEL